MSLQRNATHTAKHKSGRTLQQTTTYNTTCYNALWHITTFCKTMLRSLIFSPEQRATTNCIIQHTVSYCIMLFHAATHPTHTIFRVQHATTHCSIPLRAATHSKRENHKEKRVETTQHTENYHLCHTRVHITRTHTHAHTSACPHLHPAARGKPQGPCGPRSTQSSTGCACRHHYNSQEHHSRPPAAPFRDCRARRRPAGDIPPAV